MAMPDILSRVNRDVHARLWERLEVKFSWTLHRRYVGIEVDDLIEIAEGVDIGLLPIASISGPLVRFASPKLA
jgi:hypothetical protein